MLCSAGVGRTGTFITLDAMMERLKERDDLSIFEFVNEMRTRRKQMVQTLVSIGIILCCFTAVHILRYSSVGEQYMATITAHLQDQYAFIHDALSDYITCGDTSMMAHELRGAIVDMNQKDGTGKSGFEQQFEVRMLILHRKKSGVGIDINAQLTHLYLYTNNNNIYVGSLSFSYI